MAKILTPEEDAAISIRRQRESLYDSDTNKERIQ